MEGNGSDSKRSKLDHLILIPSPDTSRFFGMSTKLHDGGRGGSDVTFRTLISILVEGLPSLLDALSPTASSGEGVSGGRRPRRRRRASLDTDAASPRALATLGHPRERARRGDGGA